MYIPKPKDTSSITLPKELELLTEQMARNVHEVWADNRVKDGWVYGESRNDIDKTTPCIVDYDKLPQRERDYDRDTAISTIKFIISMGYEIKKIK